MKEKDATKRKFPLWVKAGIFALLATVLTVSLKRCVSKKESTKVAVNQHLLDDIDKRKHNPANIAAIDSCLPLLKSGDIVVRKGNDATSEMLCLLNQTDKSYSHCGVVQLENGYPFIYHSIGGEDNPDATLRRDSANFWFSPANNLSFGITRTDLNEQQKNSLGSVLRQFYKEKRKFDMNFDLNTNDKLYCAEMVYKAVSLAVSDSNYFTPVNLFGYRFIGIDNLYLNKHVQMVCQIRFK